MEAILERQILWDNRRESMTTNDKGPSDGDNGETLMKILEEDMSSAKTEITQIVEEVITNLDADDIYRQKEKSWHQLVGEKNFESLDKKSRDFLIYTAGSIDLGPQVDMDEILKKPIYEE